ncbi:hypothetical protein MRX96_043026 [Rhipicephalus microplus]
MRAAGGSAALVGAGECYSEPYTRNSDSRACLISAILRRKRRVKTSGGLATAAVVELRRRRQDERQGRS